jgi:hypothetical protein
MPDIAKAAVAEFKDDVEFCRRFVEDNLYQVAYSLVQDTVAATRGPGFKKIGDSLVNERGMEQRKQNMRSRWGSWLEHAKGRTVRLSAMTRSDLLSAAAERRTRADEELTRATFMERIAETLTGDETVGDRYSSDQLDEMWQTVAGAQSAA